MSSLRKLAVAILASSSLVYSQPTSIAEARAQLTVRVYNVDRAPEAILLRAQRSVDRTFKCAGIDLQWVNCTFAGASCLACTSSPSIKVTILPKSRVREPGLSYAALGVTLPTGVLVFSDKIRNLAELYRLSESQILGMVLAHELGHAFLGPGHASSGLMVANLQSHDMHSFASGQLRFGTKQAEIMQAHLRSCHRGITEFDGSRVLHPACPTAVTLPQSRIFVPYQLSRNVNCN